MHGGSRDKTSLWLATIDFLEDMAIRCNMNLFPHTHKPWSITSQRGEWSFATAEEAEYSVLLCQRVADKVTQKLAQQGYIPLPTSMVQPGLNQTQKRLRGRASAGKQPRGRRLPPILSEYESVFESSTLPTGKYNKVLRHSFKLGDNGAQINQYIVGKLRDPVQFLEEAVKTVHPMDLPSLLPDILKKAIFKVFTTEAAVLVKERSDVIKSLVKRRADLSHEEQILHNNVYVHVVLLALQMCETNRGSKICEPN